jgi:hypothetical protein
MDVSSSFTEQQEYGELLQEAQFGTGGATQRFLFVMEHLGKADHEVGQSVSQWVGHSVVRQACSLSVIQSVSHSVSQSVSVSYRIRSSQCSSIPP